MMTRTRDSGYCVAMVLQMSDIVTVPLTAGSSSSSSSSQPFRSVLQLQTPKPLKTEDPDRCRCSGDSKFQGRVSLGDETAFDVQAERWWCLRCAVGEGNASEGDFAIFRGREQQFRRSDKIGDQSDKKCEERQGRVAVSGAPRERKVIDASFVSRLDRLSRWEREGSSCS